MSGRVVSRVLEHPPAIDGQGMAQRRIDLAVLVALASHASDDGANAFPDIETIGKKALLDPRSVQRALRRLEAASRIRRSGQRPSGTIVYRVLMSTEAKRSGVTPRRRI